MALIPLRGSLNASLALKAKSSVSLWTSASSTSFLLIRRTFSPDAPEVWAVTFMSLILEFQILAMAPPKG